MAANHANTLKGISLLWESFQYLGGEMPSIGSTAQRSSGRGRGRTNAPATQNVAGNITTAAPQTQTRRKYVRRKQAGSQNS